MLQLFGWSMFGISNALTGWLHGKSVAYLWPSVAYTVLGIVITAGLRQLFKRVWTRPMPVLLTVAIAGTAVSGFLFAMGRVHSFMWLYPTSWKYEGWRDYLYELPFSMYVIVAWTASYFGIKYYRMLQKQKEAALQATATAHEAQLKMLRYQLNPHFLFNTLNAISTLILDGQNETANRMLGRLSEFMRQSLDSDPMQEVTLKQELDALHLYLGIEKLRFDERLQLQLDIEQSCYQALVPSLILQPLIENAIKYAIAPREEGGTIRLQIDLDEDWLCIVLSDDGPGCPTSIAADGFGPRGVGLRNTRDRLRVLYGKQHRFIVDNVEPHGLAVTICIPFRLT